MKKRIRFSSYLLFALTISSLFIGLIARPASTKERGPRASFETSHKAPDRMARLFLPEVGHDTSPLLRDMVQVPVTSNEMGFDQSATEAQEGMPARVTNSGAIRIAGISPDTNGEVGATQRVKIVNKGYEMFDNLTGISVLGPSDISTIWTGFGGSCETGGAGDAVVLYDNVADRWVISQFASTGGKAGAEECFAVSTSSDATGSYYRYAFHLGSNFIDSPHLSVEADGYIMGDSVYDESGTERLGSQFFVFDRTAMLAGSAANFTSPGIDTGVGETYSISADGVRVGAAPIIVAAVSTLTINLTYDPDSTFTSAGLPAQNITDMKAANVYAAAQLTNNFKDPINVNIRVTAVPGTSTLGGSSTFIPTTTFANMVARTGADATTADDATATGPGGSVPAGLVDPVGGAHVYRVSQAQSKALGITADNAVTTDGTYTFGGGFNYTYDPNNRAVAGKYDYIGVSMHEFSEIMGRIGLMGAGVGGSASYMQFDLFHYTGAGSRGLNNGAGRSFSINNGTTLLKAFNNNAVNGGDLADWASGTNDSFNAFSSSGVRNDLSAVDLRNMDVIGYDAVAGGGGTPPANDNFANAQAISGSSGSVSGTNVNATKETGEPNHVGYVGGKSVWYRWQAPSNGTMTITTLGSNFDTLLGVYTGSSVSSLGGVVSNDDDPNGGLTSRVSFNATSGAIYQIAVDGFAAASGSISLNWSFAGSVSPTWTDTDIAVGADNQFRSLWNKTDGTLALWVVAGNGSFQATTYGPYSGWTAKAIAAGSDNLMRVLWTNTNGSASLWVVAANGGFQTNVYGPYAGWTAADIGVGADNQRRVLWTNTNGSIAVWVVAANGSFQAATYGPYAGWTARRIAAGADNKSRVLWTNTDGSVALWTINADGTFQASAYGPYSGWTGGDIGVGSDNKTRVLWNHSNGSVALWTVQLNGTTQVNTYGPYAGWTARSIAVGSDNQTRVLWNNTNGSAAQWVVASNGSFQSTLYGPY